MPLLLPPSGDGPILGDVINLDDVNLLEESGRQNALDLEDATKVVSSLSLALGILFLVTTASLYAYYYSTTFDLQGRRKRSLIETKDESQSGDSEDYRVTFVKILEDLDTAFLMWGVSDKECKKRLICEAFKTDTNLKSEVKDKLKSLSKFVSQTNNSEFYLEAEPRSKEKKLLHEFTLASQLGMVENSCKTYSNDCIFSTNIMLFPQTSH